MLALLALFGPKQGLRIPLVSTVVVGRSPSADLQLVDGRVSREHCRITVTEKEVLLCDLGSQNGTYKNGRAITEPTPIAEGDEIAIGDSLLLVSGDGLGIASARYGSGTVMVSRDAATVRISGAERRSSLSESMNAELGELARRLGTSRNEEAVVEVVLECVTRVLESERASVLLCSPEGSDQERENRVVPLGTVGPRSIASVSMARLQEIRARRCGVLLEDSADCRDQEGSRTVARRTVLSVMLAPWGSPTDGLGGVLLVEREVRRPFAAEQLSFLEVVGHLLSVPLGNAERVGVAVGEGPVGNHPSFLRALERARAVARVDSTVLLLGETGTGKEELARLIDQSSPRRGGPFVAVNCGAIAETLAESELFGHEKGAFTGASATRLGAFEAADRGTVFLDEIGDLPGALQVKLLRVLQERAVVRVGATAARGIDVRIIAATHRNLAAEVEAGRFREDLLFRLNVLEIRLPPLRERLDDITLLAPVLLGRIGQRLGLRTPALGEDAVRALLTWDYPGNVRELANVLERVLVLRDPVDACPIDGDDIQAALGAPLTLASDSKTPVADEPLAQAVTRVERAQIEAALRRARGIKSKAARLLQISRPTLDKKIAELGIDLFG